MVRLQDTRLLTKLVASEKDYSGALSSVLTVSDVSLTSLTAYASSFPPPLSNTVLCVAAAFAGADEALRKYAASVDAWREDLKIIRRLEEDVGNILRDREILVTRLLRASKSKPTRDSLTASFPTAFHSSENLSIGGAKLSNAQAELQACEKHLAGKERELDQVRKKVIRQGLESRCMALVECGSAWGDRGREGMKALESLNIQNGFVGGPSRNAYLQKPLPHPSQSPRTSSNEFDSQLSSITPSQSASQIFEIPSSPAASKPREDNRPSSFTLDIPPAHAITDTTIPPGRPTTLEGRPSSSDSEIGPCEVHENEFIQQALSGRPKGKGKRSSMLSVPPITSPRTSSARPSTANGPGTVPRITRSDLGPTRTPTHQEPPSSRSGRRRSGSFSLFGSIAGLFKSGSSKKRSASSDGRWHTRTDQNLKSSRSKRAAAAGNSSDDVVMGAPIPIDDPPPTIIRPDSKYLLTTPLRGATDGLTLRVSESAVGDSRNSRKLSKRSSGGADKLRVGTQWDPPIPSDGKESGGDGLRPRKKSLKSESSSQANGHPPTPAATASKHTSLQVNGTHQSNKSRGGSHHRSGSEGGGGVQPSSSSSPSSSSPRGVATIGGSRKGPQPSLMSVVEANVTRKSTSDVIVVPKAPGSILRPPPSSSNPPSPTVVDPKRSPTSQPPLINGSSSSPLTAERLPSTSSAISEPPPITHSPVPILKLAHPRPSTIPTLPLRSALRTRSPSPVIQQAPQPPVPKPHPETILVPNGSSLHSPLPAQPISAPQQPSTSIPRSVSSKMAASTSTQTRNSLTDSADSESVYETGKEDHSSAYSDNETDHAPDTPTATGADIPPPPPPHEPRCTLVPPAPLVFTKANTGTSRPSTTDTAHAHSTSSASTAGPAPLRRKSVRMDLVPTISAAPPLAEDDQSSVVPSLPPPLHQTHAHSHTKGISSSSSKTGTIGGASTQMGGGGTVPSAWATRIEVSRSAWDDSSEEDETYGQARKALLKAQKRFEKVGDSSVSSSVSGAANSKLKKYS